MSIFERAKCRNASAVVNSKNVTAEDVTAQFVDIQSRLKSKKEIEIQTLETPEILEAQSN